MSAPATESPHVNAVPVVASSMTADVDVAENAPPGVTVHPPSAAEPVAADAGAPSMSAPPKTAAPSTALALILRRVNLIPSSPSKLLS
ncbi:hypothetical protein [Streptomyces sp. NBC_00448]|uniref:hypothetical protein n=1 Tax=Streptomyces sp. NBC_00448 TaxID=2903652 RepID=UPI002E1DD4D1